MLESWIVTSFCDLSDVQYKLVYLGIHKGKDTLENKSPEYNFI